jgi:hypothetical protein
MWNVTGYDWSAPPAATIERKVANQIRGGDVSCCMMEVTSRWAQTAPKL